MRVFNRVDEKMGGVVEAWSEGDCLKCPCNGKTACAQCDNGFLPPQGKPPLIKETSRIKLSAEKFRIFGGVYQYWRHGSFNLAYLSQDQRWVLKIQIDRSEKTDLPERAVRVWNVINPDFRAEVLFDSKGVSVAWVAPFIRGVVPTQPEIAQKILEIYQKTGRIVADAFVVSNFIKTEDGSVVCIDIGAAFFLESRSSLERIHSCASLDTWHKAPNQFSGPMSVVYRESFRQYQRDYPLIIDVTRALLYLQIHRPDFRVVSFMLGQLQLIRSLALDYDNPQRNSAELLANLDRYIASCVPVVSAASTASLFDDDEFFVQVEEDTMSPVFRTTAESNNRAQVLPTAWLGQHPPVFFQRQSPLEMKRQPHQHNTDGENGALATIA